MSLGQVSADIIACPGRLGDTSFAALQITIDGFSSPYVLTLALPAIGARALAEQVDPMKLYEALAQAINNAKVAVPLPGCSTG